MNKAASGGGSGSFGPGCERPDPRSLAADLVVDRDHVFADLVDVLLYRNVLGMATVTLQRLPVDEPHHQSHGVAFVPLGEALAGGKMDDPFDLSRHAPEPSDQLLLLLRRGLWFQFEQDDVLDHGKPPHRTGVISGAAPQVHAQMPCPRARDAVA